MYLHIASALLEIITFNGADTTRLDCLFIKNVQLYHQTLLARCRDRFYFLRYRLKSEQLHKRDHRAQGMIDDSKIYASIPFLFCKQGAIL